MPDGLETLDFDGWRDIRPAREGVLRQQSVQLRVFHLRHIFRRPVTINLIRDGIYDAHSLFGAVRLRQDEIRAAIAGQHETCRLPPTLSAEQSRVSTAGLLARRHDISASSAAARPIAPMARGLAVETGTNNENSRSSANSGSRPPAKATRATFYGLLDTAGQ
ncbi:MAG: hypothetical protein H6872_09620 [Methylobacteriaceae bacterium]|nr:hypothetical protein [Methylobacteriaceae bacterium]